MYMTVNIAIFGSCVCKDIFRSVYNKDYKKFFKVNFMQPRISYISLMNKKVDFTKEELRIEPDTPDNRYATQILDNDLSKNFLELLPDDTDYLLLDMYFEVLFGIIPFEDTYITNNYWDYPKVAFDKRIEHDKYFLINHDYRRYMKQWSKCFDQFYKEMKIKYPDTKIILNKIKMVYEVLSKEGQYYVDEEYKVKANKLNPYIDMLEAYIISNYDVIFIDMTDNIVTDENHIWGKSFVHYNKEYYMKFYEVMQRIINGEQNKYYYVKDDMICTSAEIPSQLKNVKYTLMKKANEDAKVEKTIEISQKLLDKTRKSRLYKLIKK